MNIKKKALLIFLLSCVVLSGVILFTCKLIIPRLFLNTVKPELLGTYSMTDRNMEELAKKQYSVFCSFGNKTPQLSKNDYLLCKNPDGGYYGFDWAASEFVLFDSELNELSRLQTDLPVYKITAYNNGAGLLTKENGSWNFYRIQPEKENIEPILTDIKKRNDEIPLYFDTCEELIVYTEPEGNIVWQKGEKQGEIKDLNRFLLCSYDSNSFLVLRVINYTFEYCAIEKYDINSGDFSHQRYCFCPSSSHCCLSPDKNYLISFKIVNPNGEYSPVIIDLNNPVQKTIKAKNLDFVYSQWIE